MNFSVEAKTKFNFGAKVHRQTRGKCPVGLISLECWEGELTCQRGGNLQVGAVVSAAAAAAGISEQQRGRQKPSTDAPPSKAPHPHPPLHVSNKGKHHYK